MLYHVCLFHIPVHLRNPSIGRNKLPDWLTYLDHIRPWSALHIETYFARHLLEEAAKCVQLLIRKASLAAVMKLESEHDHISVAGVAGRTQVQHAVKMTCNAFRELIAQGPSLRILQNELQVLLAEVPYQSSMIHAVFSWDQSACKRLKSCRTTETTGKGACCLRAADLSPLFASCPFAGAEPSVALQVGVQLPEGGRGLAQLELGANVALVENVLQDVIWQTFQAEVACRISRLLVTRSTLTALEGLLQRCQSARCSITRARPEHTCRKL